MSVKRKSLFLQFWVLATASIILLLLFFLLQSQAEVFASLSLPDEETALALSKTPHKLQVLPGEWVTFTLRVTNTGSITISSLTVDDPLIPGCNRTLDDLGPLQHTSYQCSINGLATFTNTAVARGLDTLGASHVASDTTRVEVTVPVYAYEDIPAEPVPINFNTKCDTSEIVRNIDVADAFTIGEVNFGFNANHTFRSHIWAFLVSPAGTVVELFSSMVLDDSNDNYDLLFDDDSSNPINDGNSDDTTAPYYDRTVGPYRSLSAFDGESSQGTWKLRICDKYPIIYHGAYNRALLVLQPAALTASHTTSQLKLLPGSAITYTTEIGNHTPYPLHDLSMENALPVSLEFQPGSLRSTTGEASENEGVVQWSGMISPGQRTLITFTAQVISATAGLISDDAIISHPSLKAPLTSSTTSQVFTDQDYFYVNEADTAIPEGGSGGVCLAPIASSIFVEEDFPIGDLRVGVSILHTLRGDLTITLTAPSGAMIALLNDVGVAENLDALFSDAGAEDAFAEGVHDVSAPFYDVVGQTGGTGSGMLATFDGFQSQGEWTLRICDNAIYDVGTLLQWSLFFDEADIWLGYSPTWEAPDNWSLNQMPSAADLAIIPGAPVGGFMPVLQTMEQTGSLHVHPGAALDLGSSTLYIEDYLINRGAFSQTLDVDSVGTGIEFLHLTNLTGDVEQFYGVIVTPTLNTLGATLVGIRANQTDGCTTVASDALLERCYSVEPGLEGEYALQLYYTEAEQNAQNASALKLWQRGRPAAYWTPAGDSYTSSESGTDCISSEGLACYLKAEHLNTRGALLAGSYSPPEASIGVVNSQVILEWLHSESDVIGYEVWQSGSSPYFTPGDPEALLLSSLPVDPENSYIFTDTTGLGEEQDAFRVYLVRTRYANAQTTDANRVGLFSSPLQPGAENLAWTSLSLPLNSGITTADGLSAYIDPAGSIQKVARWEAESQTWVVRTVGAPLGTPDFPVAVGDALLVASDSTAPASAYWLGSVPFPGSLNYLLEAQSWNYVTLPFDQAHLATADELAEAIGGVTKVARWDSTSQTWVVRTAGAPLGTPDFNIFLGFPYLVYLSTPVPITWP